MSDTEDAHTLARLEIGLNSKSIFVKVDRIIRVGMCIGWSGFVNFFYLKHGFPFITILFLYTCLQRKDSIFLHNKHEKMKSKFGEGEEKESEEPH